MLLSRRIEEHRRRFHRPAARLPAAGEDEEGPLDLGNVSVWDLLTAFHRIQLAIGERGPHRVLFEDRPLESYIETILTRADATSTRRVVFDELFAECRDIYDAVGFFLAILEMAKRRLLRLYQEELFGPIEVLVRSREEVEAEEAALSAARQAEEEALEGRLPPGADGDEGRDG